MVKYDIYFMGKHIERIDCFSVNLFTFPDEIVFYGESNEIVFCYPRKSHYSFMKVRS